MGTAGGFGKAYWKAQAATGKPIPSEGVAAIDLSAAEFPDPASDAGRDLRDGFADHFDCRAFDDLAAAIRRGEVDLVISRDRAALEVAVEEAVTYFSTEASARAALDGLAAREADPAVAAVDRRPKRDAEWGRAD
jgi:carbamoyl-phosphate synthase large subunit